MSARIGRFAHAMPCLADLLVRLGERLSPYVALSCVAMAFAILLQ